tara:strand:- start:72 stop:455 length:384 start_codon:yes stop_codon:yes gene_type:complete
MSDLKIFNVVNEGSKARLVPLSTQCEEYNGWTNRETWAVNLHLSNKQDWYQGAIDQVAAQLHIAADTSPVYMGDVLREYWDTDIFCDPDLELEWEVMVLRDVGSEWRVNWTEIAGHWIADTKEHLDL